MPGARVEDDIAEAIAGGATSAGSGVEPVELEEEAEPREVDPTPPHDGVISF